MTTPISQPASSTVLCASSQDKHLETALPSARVTILVVDDEPAILDLLSRALSSSGFDVRLAVGGDQAVQVYERNRDSIALVLIDVRMPGLDGPNTLVAIRKLNPHVRFCFMSGGTGKYAETDLLALGASHVLAKPFRSLDELAHTLRQIATGGQ